MFEFAVYMSFTKDVTVKCKIGVNIHITNDIIVLLIKTLICVARALLDKVLFFVGN